MSNVPSLPSHLLICTVCQGKYFSKSEWSQHLTGEGHQSLAREKYLKKWRHSPETKCCLVIFSSFALTSRTPSDSNAEGGVRGGGDKVIQYFSNNPATFVSDFVVWKERPCIGVVQFESKKKLEDVIISLGSARKILIEKKRVKVKKVTHLSEIEWSAILPMASAKPKPSSTSNGNGTGSTKSWSSSSTQTAKMPKPTGSKEGNSSSSVASRNLLTDDFFMESLQLQYAKIQSSIRIPDEKFDQALGIVSILKRLFSISDRTSEVVMFRNWYLKLKSPNPVEDDLLIFVYNSRPPTDQSSSYTCVKSSVVDLVFLMIDGKKEFSVLPIDPVRKPEVTEQTVWRVKHKTSGIVFHLFTNHSYLMEVQPCRLVEYLCKFDPRCYPLLTLAYHWTKQNTVHFGNSTSGGGSLREADVTVPMTLTLPWLVIFYLSHKKYIPTPTEIQSISKEKLIDRSTERDIGFSADLVFANEWKSTNSNNPAVGKDESSDEFMLSVLVLFQNFLEFYGNILKSGSCVKILDTGNGTVHDVLTTVHKSATFGCHSKNMERNGEIQDFKLYITHPFFFSWKYSVAKDIQLVLKAMESGGVELKEFLIVWKKAEAEKKQCGSLEKVLAKTNV